MLRKNLVIDSADLPSTRQLRVTTIIALLVAIAIFIFVYLPAEYGIDPTGFGRHSGLSQMGIIKTSLATELAVEKDAKLLQTNTGAVSKLNSNSITLKLNTGEAAEIKLKMNKDQVVEYAWHTTGGKLNVDAHGDPYNAPKGFYHGYGKKIMINSDQGRLVAAFDGYHGWFWRNRSNEPAILILEIKGDYQDFRRVK